MTAPLPRRFVCPRCGEPASAPGACPRDREELRDASEDELLGTELGGYRVAEQIGRGGMGAVYRAVQVSIDAEVAIKVLARDLIGDRESSERFVNEARIANKVRHEGLVKVLFIGLLPDGRPYLIMEHLTGKALARLIGTLLPLGTLLRRLAEAMRAIAAMHDAGVIHRDLKPGNLFVTTAGYIKVLDFGIAKLADEHSGLTRTGHTIGTPGYMSPEQAQAEPLDPRSDVYALGVVLYEVLVGQRPFEGRVIEALAERARPPALPDRVPRALDAIVQRAMSPAPDDRFATAAAFADALEEVASTLPADLFGPLGEAPLAIQPVAPTAPVSTEVVPEIPPTLPARRPIERLGRYIVEGTAGRGGEGVVLAGRDPKVQRRVALKLLAADTADRRARMIAEAQAMARVNHPNVVTLYELGEDGDQLFLAMEYLEAVDLEHWLAQQPRRWQDILAMFAAAGRGLAAAHAVGVVHRDFKPANVLLGGDLRPRVGDFGIAGVESSAGDGAGTPAFMAPEQLAGAHVDARADQYAFCAALWHALHGEPPYPGATASAIAIAAKRGELRAPAREVPAALTQALRRGLAYDPEARFADLPALLAALERIAAPRRSRRVLAAGAGVLAAGAVTAFALTRTPSEDVPPLPTLAEIRALPDPMAQLRALGTLPPYAVFDPDVRTLARDAMAHGRVATTNLDVDPIADAASFARDGTLVIPSETTTIAISPDGTRRSYPAAPRPPRRVFLAEAELRVLVDDAILATPLDRARWRVVSQCRGLGGSRWKVRADQELRSLACEGDIWLEGTRVPLAFTGVDVVAFTPSGRIVVQRPDVLEMFDPTGTRLLARKSVTIEGEGLVALDDLAAWVEPGGFGWWDVRRDAVEHASMPADRVELIGGDRATAVITRELMTRHILLADQSLGELVNDARIQVAGERVVHLATAELVVRDHASGRAWRLPGAPGHVVADPRRPQLAAFDGRRLRWWSLEGPSPVSIPRPLCIVHDELLLFGRLPHWTTPLVAYDLGGRQVDRVDVPTAKLGESALITRPGGPTWRWLPRQHRLEEVAPDELDQPRELAGEIYYTKDRSLVRLRDGQPACPMLQDTTHPEVLVVLTGEGAIACRVRTGERVRLQLDAARASESFARRAWRVSPDGSRAGFVEQGKVVLFDTRSGAPVAAPAGLAGYTVTQFQFGDDPERLAIVAKEGVLVVDREQVTALATSLLKAARFTPGDHQVVGLSRGRILVWDTATRVQHELGMVASNEMVTDFTITGESVVVTSRLGNVGRTLVFPLAPPSPSVVAGWLAKVR